MNCPHCSASLSVSADECIHCGFHISTVRAILGAEWVRLERLTDPGSCLSLHEKRHLEVVLDDFERSFPQSFLAVYIGSLPPLLNARTLGFWLLNHGAFETGEVAKRNDFGAVLVLDLGNEGAGLTLGYALEPLISEEAACRMLEAMQGPFQRRHYGEAVERVVWRMKQCLMQAGQAQEQPRAAALSHGLGLQLLRSGHQKTAARQATSG